MSNIDIKIALNESSKLQDLMQGLKFAVQDQDVEVLNLQVKKTVGKL